MALLGMGLLSTSCDDQLNALPTQQIVEEDLITDAASAEVALNGVYYCFVQAGTDYFDSKSTSYAFYYEIMPSMFSGLANYGYGTMSLELHSNDGYGDYLWSYFYTTVTAANSVIAQMEEADDSWFSDDRKTEIIAEAKLLRAYSYYELLRWFGYHWDIDSEYGIILRSEPTSVYNQSMDRSSVSETYDFILDDIDYAITYGPSADSRGNYYVNEWVARGLKARVLMLRGEGTDYADAASLAAEIINSGEYTLESNMTDIFDKGLDSSEVMFGTYPYSGQAGEFNRYFSYGSTPYYPLSDAFIALYADDDPRLTALMKSNYMLDYNTYTYSYRQLNCKHYDLSSGSYSDDSEVCYPMRLTEFYLLRAEALVYTGGDTDEIKSLVKTIETCAGLTDFSAIEEASTDEELLREIYVELLRNMFNESGRELDPLMRMPTSVVEDICPYTETPATMVLPIPDDEFDFNSALTSQNPGYSS